MNPRDRLTRTSRLVTRIAVIINRLFLLAVATGFTLSCIFPAQFAYLMISPANIADQHQELVGLRLLMLIGVVMALATDRLLCALGHVIASAGLGDPFAPANVRRLRSVGWSLLVLQLLDIPGALLARFFPAMGSAAPTGDISIGGWFAVLMVFVLSRAFAAGSAIRDDLVGTV